MKPLEIFSVLIKTLHNSPNISLGEISQHHVAMTAALNTLIFQACKESVEFYSEDFTDAPL